MDNGSQIGLQLTRLAQGGFMVSDSYMPGEDRYIMRQFHFASTTIDEALQFMRDKINPISPTAGPVEKTDR